MMCGGVAHGSILDCVRNGGCGYTFNYRTLAAEGTFYYGIDGKRKNGVPSSEERLKAARIVQRLEREGYSFGQLYENEKNVRLVLCGDTQGLSCLIGRCGGFAHDLSTKDWFRNVPKELEDRGVTQSEWRERMDELELIQRSTGRCCCPCRAIMCLFCIPPMFLIGVFIFLLDMCHLGCFFRWAMCDPFQRGCERWARRFNDEVLRKKNLYAKFFTFARGTVDDDGNVSRIDGDGGCKSVSTLAFALSTMEILRFETEPALQKGYTDDPNFALWACCPWNTDRIV